MNNTSETTSSSSKDASRDSKSSNNGKSMKSTDSQNGDYSLATMADTAREYAMDVGQRFSVTGKKVATWTKANPVQAALIGAGVGFLAGTFARGAMKSRSKSS